MPFSLLTGLKAVGFLVCLLVATLATPVQAQYTVQAGKIYDNLGREVQLRGVNWFGFETDTYAPHGLWARNWQKMIAQMKSLEINAVRVPVCPDTLRGVSPKGIDYALNPDLKGLNSLEILDKVMAEFSKQRMYVLLDHHRPDCEAISELWYTDTYSEVQWINDLVFMAKRYRKYKYFIGLDLKNEPHGRATWATGDRATDWNHAAERAARSVLTAVPDILVFVEGVQSNRECSDDEDGHWWGGNLQPFSCAPLDIPPDRLVLSPHVYGPDVHPQPYFDAPDFPNNMPAIWQRHFGQFLGQSYAVILGEFGGRYGHGGDPKDRIWQDTLVQYLVDRGVSSAFYWSWNPNSGDTGGLLRDDWKTVWPTKHKLLQRLWYGGRLQDSLRPRLPACSDGLDNDSDGLIDAQDPGCEGARDNNEFNPAPGQVTVGGAVVDTRTVSDWGQGYCVDVTVTNARKGPLEWHVDVPVEGRINNLWNGNYETSGDRIRVKGVEWNRRLEAGSSTNFGFCAERDGHLQKQSPIRSDANNSAQLETQIRMQSDWGQGYCADVLVTNSGVAAVDWKVSLQVDGRIYNLWKARHRQQGKTLTAEGYDYNNLIQPGETVDFGFCANR